MSETKSDMFLTDDGTLDTVIECGKCGGQERYNFEPEHADGNECPYSESSCGCYDAFVEWALEDACELHECEDRGMGDDGNGAGEGF